MEISKQLANNPRTGLTLKAVFDRMNIAPNEQEAIVQFKIIEIDKQGKPYKPESSAQMVISTIPNTYIAGVVGANSSSWIDNEKAKTNAEKLKAFNAKVLALIAEEFPNFDFE